MVLLLIRMAKALSRNRNGSRSGSTKYDAHQKVLSQTYGALADLRRELSDSKSAVAEREELLNSFSVCADSQRAWLLLEDYFEKLSLSRRDFPSTDWWPRLLAAQGKGRCPSESGTWPGRLRRRNGCGPATADFPAPPVSARLHGAGRWAGGFARGSRWPFCAPPTAAAPHRRAARVA